MAGMGPLAAIGLLLVCNRGCDYDKVREITKQGAAHDERT